MADIKVEGRRTQTPPKRTPPAITTKPAGIKSERVDAVDGIWQLTGLGFIMTGQFADAGAIEMHGHAISEEIADLAENNDRVAKVVDTLLQVGPYAGLVTALMPLVLQLLANHKVVDAHKLASADVVPPEVLESQVKTLMAQRAMEALRAQQDAEAELQKIREEMMRAQNGNEST